MNDLIAVRNEEEAKRSTVRPAFIVDGDKIVYPGISVQLVKDNFITVVTDTHLVFYKQVVNGGKKYTEVKRTIFNFDARTLPTVQHALWGNQLTVEDVTEYRVNGSEWTKNKLMVINTIEREMCMFSRKLMKLLHGDEPMVSKDAAFSELYCRLVSNVLDQVKHQRDGYTGFIMDDFVVYNCRHIIEYSMENSMLLIPTTDCSDPSDLTKWEDFLVRMNVPYYIKSQTFEHPEQINHVDTIVIGTPAPSSTDLKAYGKWFTKPDDGLPRLEIPFINGVFDGFDPSRH